MLNIGEKAILKTHPKKMHVLISARGYDAINKTGRVRDIQINAFGLVFTSKNVSIDILEPV